MELLMWEDQLMKNMGPLILVDQLMKNMEPLILLNQLMKNMELLILVDQLMKNMELQELLRTSMAHQVKRRTLVALLMIPMLLQLMLIMKHLRKTPPEILTLAMQHPLIPTMLHLKLMPQEVRKMNTELLGITTGDLVLKVTQLKFALVGISLVVLRCVQEPLPRCMEPV